MQINVIRRLNQEQNSLSMIFTFIMIILMFLQVFMGKSSLYIHKFRYASLLSFRITVLYDTVAGTDNIPYL